MQDFLFIKDGLNHIKVLFSELLYAEAVNRYVRFVTIKNKVYLSKCYLSDIETLLPSDQFCRIHRSYLISLGQIKQFTSREVLIGDTQLPIGRHYRDMLLERVVIASGAFRLSRKQINDLFKRPDQL